MRELPILYIADMVKAIDEGRKTHTRRIIKPQPISPTKDAYFDKYNNGPQWNWWTKEGKQYLSQIIKCPYQPGDHLWIKQNFQITKFCDKFVTGSREDGSHFIIKLTNDEWAKFKKWKQPYAKKSKLFMFKSLAYKWIEIVSVRAERLQDITKDDILKESLTGEYMLYQKWITLWDSINAKPKPKIYKGKILHYESYPWFEDVADRKKVINGKPHYCYPNAFVWVYQFKRIEK